MVCVWQLLGGLFVLSNQVMHSSRQLKEWAKGQGRFRLRETPVPVLQGSPSYFVWESVLESNTNLSLHYLPIMNVLRHLLAIQILAPWKTLESAVPSFHRLCGVTVSQTQERCSCSLLSGFLLYWHILIVQNCGFYYKFLCQIWCRRGLYAHIPKYCL